MHLLTIVIEQMTQFIDSAPIENLKIELPKTQTKF